MSLLETRSTAQIPAQKKQKRFYEHGLFGSQRNMPKKNPRQLGMNVLLSNGHIWHLLVNLQYVQVFESQRDKVLAC